MSKPHHDTSWDVYTSQQENEDEDSCIPHDNQITHFIPRHKQLFQKYANTFSRTVNKEPAKVPPMVLQVDDTEWEHARNQLPPRVQSAERQEAIHTTITTLITLSCIRQSLVEYWSQLHMVKKPNNRGWRVTQDLKNLNKYSKGMGYPIPNIKAILERIGNRKAKYYATLDLTSGYHQIPLAEESRKYTAFTSAFGLYEWLRVPMGLKAAGHYFQYVLATIVLVGIIYIACESYIDDILVFGKDEDEYFANLEEVLKRFKKHNITINPDKCVFGATEIVYVGHLITANGITHTHVSVSTKSYK